MSSMSQMSGMIGAASGMLGLGISPWILPLIAVAAKLKEEEADDAGLHGRLRRWLGGARCARTAERNQAIADEQIKPPLDTVTWPE